MLKRNASTGKLLRGTNGLCRTCCVEYSGYDCGVFLDPATPEWDADTAYVAGDVVEQHESTTRCSGEPGEVTVDRMGSGDTGTYKCTQANTGIQPDVTSEWSNYWVKMTNNASITGNTGWNSVSPFGGIGKSPKKYTVSFSGIALNSEWGSTLDVNDIFTLETTGGCWYSKVTSEYGIRLWLQDHGELWDYPDLVDCVGGYRWWVEFYDFTGQYDGQTTGLAFVGHGNSPPKPADTVDSKMSEIFQFGVGDDCWYGISICSFYACGESGTCKIYPGDSPCKLSVAWQTAHAYVVGDLVYTTTQETCYRCIQAHTSDGSNTPPNATYWELVP